MSLTPHTYLPPPPPPRKKNHNNIGNLKKKLCERVKYICGTDLSVGKDGPAPALKGLIKYYYDLYRSANCLEVVLD